MPLPMYLFLCGYLGGFWLGIITNSKSGIFFCLLLELSTHLSWVYPKYTHLSISKISTYYFFMLTFFPKLMYQWTFLSNCVFRVQFSFPLDQWYQPMLEVETLAITPDYIHKHTCVYISHLFGIDWEVEICLAICPKAYQWKMKNVTEMKKGLIFKIKY